MFQYVPSRPGIGEVSAIAAAVIDAAIQKEAERILSVAKSLAHDAGETVFADSLHIETSVRPKGRGQVQVVADSPGAASVEYGDSNSKRRRILGQAAGVQIFPTDGPIS